MHCSALSSHRCCCSLQLPVQPEFAELNCVLDPSAFPMVPHTCPKTRNEPPGAVAPLPWRNNFHPMVAKPTTQRVPIPTTSSIRMIIQVKTLTPIPDTRCSISLSPFSHSSTRNEHKSAQVKSHAAASPDYKRRRVCAWQVSSCCVYAWRS